MPVLVDTLRRSLEKDVQAARTAAEDAAAKALTTLAVNQSNPFPAMTDADKRLRRLLRAKARQLGDDDHLKKLDPLGRDWALVRECAYEQWHRMLFARFLAENNLLIHPDYGTPVSLAECAELAPLEGAADAWTLAARYAAHMLPGIFRQDDPLLQVRFAAEGRQALEQILDRMPQPVFTADDSLGWVYQFWQGKQKEEVNKSGRKIGGADIAPVTQLFTEPYMVQFLLHNSLGAWWAARHPNDALVDELTYLRRLPDGTPAAGSFDGWPARAADLKVLDPCCGSGHFIVAAWDLLRRMRETEEGLTPAEAALAVIRDNVFGLELDARCTQIAAFALALAAWKVAGYCDLPVPNIACSGIPVGGRLYEWLQLAGGDPTLEMNLRRLYNLFKDAPDLGSLIDPRRELEGTFFADDTGTLLHLLDKALRKEKGEDDPAAAIFGDAAKGLVRAASLLAGEYHLIATNVPFLARGKQNQTLQDYSLQRHSDAKTDLATVFLERCRAFCAPHGSYALVTPQNWLFLGSYKHLREKLLTSQSINVVARLAAGGFESTAAGGASVALSIITNQSPTNADTITTTDASSGKKAVDKAAILLNGSVQTINQAAQLRNADARITFDNISTGVLLARFAQGVHGLGTKDSPRFTRCFWEIPEKGKDWEFIQSTVPRQCSWGGMEHVVYWQQAQGILHELGKKGWAVLAGGMAWGKPGVCISQMGELPASIYSGEIFDKNVAVISPEDPKHLPAIWAFCSSPEYNQAVRRIDQKVNVTNNTLVKVPFDLAHWQAVADAAGPLPEPHSDDPTQWLFKGHPGGSTNPLHVAVARLLGYRWPQQADDGLSQLADQDGILCLPAVAGEQPAAERLRQWLQQAYGAQWSPAAQERLLADVGHAGKTLHEWLHGSFFAQHCKLFHNRPFLWHIWDGMPNGFAAIVNYHTLDRAKLDRLIYTYLGDWITAQRNDVRAGKAGADVRLSAAQKLKTKLEAIRDGEPPYDIYVRWKPLHAQPLGWEPDLNDGVRLNIRPFVHAGVLRARFTINWNKDRGKNPDGSERLNDLHFSRAEKEAARAELQA